MRFRVHPALIAAIIVLGIPVAMIGGVLLSGQTFPQRCNRAFPNDPRRAELCTSALSDGDYQTAFGEPQPKGKSHD